MFVAFHPQRHHQKRVFTVLIGGHQAILSHLRKHLRTKFARLGRA